VATNKRYAGNEGYTVSEVAEKVKRDFGSVDVLVSAATLCTPAQKQRQAMLRAAARAAAVTSRLYRCHTSYVLPGSSFPP
jgi:enoyl-[acyl-carrier protein] reductase I